VGETEMVKAPAVGSGHGEPYDRRVRDAAACARHRDRVGAGYSGRGHGHSHCAVVEKLQAAWVRQAPPGSFDCALSSAVLGDKSVRRSAQR
jgi:hypothetical protein